MLAPLFNKSDTTLGQPASVAASTALAAFSSSACIGPLSRADRNKDEETQKKYEVEKKKCLDNIEDHENIVVLSLLVESSVEASFQVKPLLEV